MKIARRVLVGLLTVAASSVAVTQPSAAVGGNLCSPGARILGYSDALDKSTADGIDIGGLSGIAPQARRDSYVAVSDHAEGQLRLLTMTHVTGAWSAPEITGSITLTDSDGSPVDAAAYDTEGVVALRGGYVLSEENGPSIHQFDRSGQLVGTLPVPNRFRITPDGEGRENAGLEGLGLSPDGRTLYAAMEGELSGDISSTGDDTTRRILVYERSGDGFVLARQVGYRVEPGQRIAEVVPYGIDQLLVLEVSWQPDIGNTLRLYSADLTNAPDLTDVSVLGDAPGLMAPKTLSVDVGECPSLGAIAKQPQPNPILDNYEAMSIVRCGAGLAGRESEVVLVSDDNFNPTQITRVVRLAIRLP